ncbi:MAG: LuxR C-terminal-related transcriptional regulator [Acidobacteria bacterium]|nr:LuxR C-terminal-related transcriptional regulator [Acidobacteriota bacterium]
MNEVPYMTAPEDFDLTGIRIAIVENDSSDQPAYLLRLLEAGSHGIGFLVKDRTSQARFVSAVTEVHEKRNALDYTVFADVLKLQAKVSPNRQLTDEQVKILRLIVEGLKNRAIADRLHLSEPVVERRISDIFDCLGIDRRATSETNYRVVAVVRYLSDLQEYYETRDIVTPANGIS